MSSKNRHNRPEEETPETVATPAEETPPEKTPCAETEPDELELMTRRNDELNDRYLRTLAEYENFRKRSRREHEGIYPVATAAAVEKFLPVADDFERALAIDCTDSEFKKGVDMIFLSFKKALSDLGITEIGIVGECFDANIHHAVMHIEDEKLAENSVAQVMQKGYRLGDKVIRCAMVSVAN